MRLIIFVWTVPLQLNNYLYFAVYLFLTTIQHISRGFGIKSPKMVDMQLNLTKPYIFNIYV